MKNLLIIFTLLLSTFLFSCEDDTDDNKFVTKGVNPVLAFYSFFPEQAQAGNELYLSLHNFDLSYQGTTVTIGHEIAEHVSSDTFTLVVKIPEKLKTGYYPITVASNGDYATHESMLFVNARQVQR